MPDDPQEAFNEKARDSLTTRAGQEGAKDMTREMEMILEAAFEEGKAEGIAEVMAEERAAREKIGEARFAAMMLKDGRYSFEEILKMTGLSAERVIEAKGRLEGMTEIAEKMLNDGYPIKEILSKTGLTAEQIRWVREAEGEVRRQMIVFRHAGQSGLRHGRKLMKSHRRYAPSPLDFGDKPLSLAV